MIRRTSRWVAQAVIVITVAVSVTQGALQLVDVVQGAEPPDCHLPGAPAVVQQECLRTAEFIDAITSREAAFVVSQ